MNTTFLRREKTAMDLSRLRRQDRNPYRFLVYGDNRTRHDVHRKVIAEVMKHGIPDFILQTGDMVEDGNDSALWPIFFDIEKDLLRQSAFFPAIGNHERTSHYVEDIFQEGAVLLVRSGKFPYHRY